MKKQISIFLLMLLMLFTTASGAFAEDEMIPVTIGGVTNSYPKANVLIDNNIMTGEMPGVLYGDTTMVPIRFISEGIGGEVGWDNGTQEVTIKLNSKVIAIKIGSSEAIVDGVKKYIPEGKSPILMNSRTMVPLRFVSEELGAKVDWDNDTRTASIKTDRFGADVDSRIEIKGIVKETVNGREAIVIKTSGEVTYAQFKLDNPTRVVIDINNTKLSEGEKEYLISGELVEKVRTGEQPNNASRVVLDIKSNVALDSYAIQKSGNDLVVYTNGSQKLFYNVYQDDVLLKTFSTESEAIAEARNWYGSTVMLGGSVIWDFMDNLSAGGKTIVIDPGHGGSDPGAISYSRKYEEADLALSVGLKLESELKARGYTVIMTRRTDVYPTLSERSRIANNANADGFISIHFNAATPAATGLETLYKNEYNKQFATDIQNSLISSAGGRNRGIKVRTDLAVLNGTKGYAALVELGFITNPSDEARLASESYHYLCADALANGVDNFFER